MNHTRSQVQLTAFLVLLMAGCASTQHEGRIRTVTVEGAPKPVGPYSQGIVAGGFLYASGQLPRDPSTGKLATGDIAVQAARVFDNLEAVLKGAGCSLQDVVKVDVFMTDLGEFAKMNEIYAARFGDHRPARTTVQVSQLPFPGALLEVDMVARIPQ